MKTKKVILKVEPTKNSMKRIFDTMKSRSRKYEGQLIVSFPDFKTMGKVLSGSRLEILAAIRGHKPKSIQELARLIERDFKNVYQDVKFLESFGLITLKIEGSRRPSAPRVLFEELVLAA